MIDSAHFLGIIMWMGIVKLPEMHMFWARTMTRDRFDALKKYFHMFNRKAIPKNNTDKLIIVRPVLEFLMEKCCTLYVPSKNLSIDEGMLKWKGHLSIRVYNPQKLIKYGIKFYFLCEAKTGYILDCIIYRGVTSTLRDIVFRLLGCHLQKGYLAEELYQQDTHVRGTLWLVRGAPKSVQKLASKKVLRHGEMLFRRKENNFVICWQDVRLVSFITTGYDASTEEFIRRRRVRRRGRFAFEEETMQRPKVVRQYVNYMGGVDKFDQLINYYAVARRTYRWTQKTVFYMLQMALLNAYVLYRQYPPDRVKMPPRHFQEVGLIGDCLMNYNEAHWLDSGHRIPRAESLPVD